MSKYQLESSSVVTNGNPTGKGSSAATGSKPVGIKLRIRLILTLVGGFLIHLALGAIYTFGNISPYMVSYMRNRTDETSLRNVDGLWITSIGSVSNCIGMVIGGILDHRFGHRVASGIACFVYCLSVSMNYFSVQSSFAALILTYGVASNLGLVAAYGVTLQTVIKWLPNRPSLGAGLVLSGFGAGALVFNQVITGYINPENLSPDYITDNGERYFTDPDLLDRVPYCFLILAGCYSILHIIGVACMTSPPEYDASPTSSDVEIIQMEQQLEKNGSINGINNTAFSITDSDVYKPEVHTMSAYVETTNTKENEIKANEASFKNSTSRLTILQAVKLAFRTRSFYLVWLTLLCIDGGVQFVATLYKAYGQTFINDDWFLALIGSLSSIFNCVGRPIWGMVMDRFGFRAAVRCISFGCVVGIGTLLFTEHMDKGFFCVWLCTIFFFFSGIWAVIPSTLAKLFGTGNMSVNYGFINTAVMAASILGGISGLTLKSIVGWHGMFFMSAGLAAIPFFLTFVFNGVDLEGKRI